MIKNILNILIIIPYFWIFLLTTVLMIIFAVKTENKKAKLILSNLVFVPLVLCICEVVCWKINSEFYFEKIITGRMSNKLYEYSRKSGCIHCKNVKVHATGKYRGEKVYDVYYNIDKNGLRVTPSSNNQADKCLLFFGDSFMFGLALNDNETLPYYLGEKTNNKYKIYNFGVGGYSPASVLSQIESSRVANAAKSCKTSTAIIDFMPDHIVRVAGKKTWSEWTPYYELVDGEIVYKGTFHKRAGKLSGFIKEIMLKSQTYIYINRIIVSENENLGSEEFVSNLDLSIAILNKSRKLLREKCNVNRFIVVYYDDIRQNQDIVNRLNINSFEYYPVAGILPDFQNKANDYFIKGDNHPSKYSNEKLADFLVKQLNLK